MCIYIRYAQTYAHVCIYIYREREVEIDEVCIYIDKCVQEVYWLGQNMFFLMPTPNS